MNRAQTPTISRQTLAGVLMVGGSASLIASLALTIEQIHFLENPGYQPACDVSPIVSCTSVMSTPQGSLLGFSNSLIGIAAFSVVITLGVLVVGRVRLPDWIWHGLQVGLTLAVVFVQWLFYQSLYRIGSMCPYCVTTWVSVIAMFWYVTLHNLSSGRIPTPTRFARVVRAATTMHSTGLTLWYILLASLVGIRFWDYWQSLFS